MKSFINRFARFVSSSKGSKIIIACWLAAIIVLALVAPGSNDVKVSTGEGSIHENTPSTIAQDIQDKQFPSKDGSVALLVFHDNTQITGEDRTKIEKVSKWLSSDNKPKNVASALPFHKMPKQVQNKLISKDGTTMQINVAMKKGLDSDQMYDTFQKMNKHVDQIIGNDHMEMKITGPAGISADTVSLFKNADLVLMFATIGLILVLLILIYRSPLLAVIPLIVAGIVYMVVDRILGLGGDNGWFVVDSQATSIMMILLFAVLTDYSMFILSRFRRELKKVESKHEAMKRAFSPLVVPILFSGGTVLIAMIVLFFTNFKPYHHFAPVFSIAMVFILLGGITLIPAIFTLAGRRAFWPFIPKVEDEDKKAKHKGFWTKIGSIVTNKPAIPAGILLVLLLAASVNAGTMKFSFNQLKSFPDDIPSRQGFELLADHFPQGKLAPVTVIMKSNERISVDQSFAKKIDNLEKSMKHEGGIEEISPELNPDEMSDKGQLPRNFLSKSKHAVKLQLTLKNNPYDQSSLNVVENLRDKKDSLLKSSGLDPKQFSLHYAGQTADQVDVRSLNQRDTIIAFSAIAVLIAIMLIIQSGSFVTGIIMILTMLLSYAASLGLGWFVFHDILRFHEISYRLPLYTFVFLISLGVDYNIILVSRIKEEAQRHSWKDAISRGVSLTGGVISSAGIILAGTFTVLMTQPLQELFLFGLTMGMGILIDTFFVRGMLLPSILTFIKPKKSKHLSSNHSTDISE